MEKAEGRLPDKKGYGFDACSPKILMERAEVSDGLISFPGGSSYRVMVLPTFETMTPKLLEKIRELVKVGATIIGSPAQKSPSLVDYPACDEKLQALSVELWGRLKVPDEITKRRYGNGNVYWGGNSSDGLYPDYSLAASVLKAMGIDEDFNSNGSIRYAHRQTKEREIYFLSNKSDQTIQADCKFRVGKGHPKLWNPVTGTSRPLPQFKQEKGITTIPMEFVAHQSFFVVFSRSESTKTQITKSNINFPKTVPLKVLKGSWDVSFDPKWGGPGKVTFDELQDWSKNENSGIKYYSGIATYHKTFNLPESLEKGSQICLNLGMVHEMARVRLNGKDLGVVWCEPWQVDITDALKVGVNEIEIEVANLWPNRLIGDAAKPQEERLTWTILEHPYKAESKLLPSGLLGPVQFFFTYF
jgi:hypothetical protein